MVSRNKTIGLFDYYNDSIRIADSEFGNLLIKRPINYIVTASDNRHVISSGETLSSISHRYYNTDRYAVFIAEVNNILNPFEGLELQLEVGSIIIIPDVIKIAL